MPTDLYLARLGRLRDALRHHDLDALAANAGPTLRLLTGLDVHLSERPVVGLFGREGTPALVLPELETGKLRGLDLEVQAFTYTEDLTSWGDAFRRALEAAGLQQATVGVEPLQLRVLELRYLEGAAPDASFVSAEDAVAELRMPKDEASLATMREAVGMAQRALQATLPTLRAGVTEREVAATLVQHLLREGSEPELPFQPIVAFGAHSANPHASPSERTLQEGDLVLFDWGARHHGYCSDLTRTFAFGAVTDELAEIAAVVAKANAAARQKAAPGVTAGEVDRAARAVIEEAGYGDYFVHRTGHGIGLDVHEPPYVRAGNDVVLAPGMTITIEPGIYLTDRGGVRIEDDVVVTEDGAESLSDLPRDLVDLR